MVCTARAPPDVHQGSGWVFLNSTKPQDRLQYFKAKRILGIEATWFKCIENVYKFMFFDF